MQVYNDMLCRHVKRKIILPPFPIQWCLHGGAKAAVDGEVAAEVDLVGAEVDLVGGES